MAARGRVAIKPVPIVQAPGVDDPKTQHNIEVIRAAISELQSHAGPAHVKVTGSRASGAALKNLLTALAAAGIIVDDTVA